MAIGSTTRLVERSRIVEARRAAEVVDPQVATPRDDWLVSARQRCITSSP